MLEITSDDIARLDDGQFREVVARLCEAEVRSRGLSASQEPVVNDNVLYHSRWRLESATNSAGDAHQEPLVTAISERP